MSRRLSVLAAPRHRLRCRIRGHAGFAGVAATAAALVLVPSALAIGVHVRVEGKTQTIFGSTEPTLSVQATAMDALEAASLAGEFYYHVVTASFGRYVDQIGPIASNANPVSYTYAYALGVDLNGDQHVQRNELQKWLGFSYYDPTNPGALISSTRMDYGMKPQRSDEFIAGFERELLTDFSVGINGTYRKIHNITGRLFENGQLRRFERPQPLTDQGGEHAG